MPEVKMLTALSKAHIYLLISKGEFPKQHKLGKRAAAWLFSDIQEWMESRISTSREEEVLQ